MSAIHLGDEGKPLEANVKTIGAKYRPVCGSFASAGVELVKFEAYLNGEEYYRKSICKRCLKIYNKIKAQENK